MHWELRDKIKTDVFDYLVLSDVLSSYSNIRGKIGRLLADGEIIRIKKGIYAFAPCLRRFSLNEGIIASMLYGPSYVSRDFALARYGLIPESVYEVTSITRGRPRTFVTPVGRFSYLSNLSSSYGLGVTHCIVSEQAGGYMLAQPEKALFDKASCDLGFSAQSDVESYLEDSLRIEISDLKRFDKPLLRQLRSVARGRMRFFVDFLLKL